MSTTHAFRRGRPAAVAVLVAAILGAPLVGGCGGTPVPDASEKPLASHPNPLVGLGASVGGTFSVTLIPIGLLYPVLPEDTSRTLLRSFAIATSAFSEATAAPVYLVQLPFWTLARAIRAGHLSQRATEAPNVRDRIDALKAIAEEGHDGGILAVSTALSDPEPQVRAVAAQVAAEIDAGTILERLLSRADTEPQPEVRSLLLGVSGKVARIEAEKGTLEPEMLRAVHRVLVRHLRIDSFPAARAASASGLGHLARPPRATLEALWDATGDPAAIVRQHVALAVGQVGLPEGMELLQILVRDPEFRVRSAVALALGNMGDERVMTLLRELARDEDLNVRGWAADAAGRSGLEGSRELLRMLARDEAPQVRRMARRGLRQAARSRAASGPVLGGWWLGDG